MVKKDIIPHLKSCCLSLGLMTPGVPQPIAIGGTGFIVDKEGFLVTADHVVDDLEKFHSELKEKGEKSEFAAFYFEEGDEVSGQVVAIPIKEVRSVKIDIHGLEDRIPQDHDIAIARLAGKYDNLPHLNFKEPSKLSVFDEVFACGYPGGDFTMNFRDKKHGMRVSPIVQYGHVGSLMPSDKTNNPIGIQTDIVGTGGSSGSPIVDANTEEIIGIAQRVIPSVVNDFSDPPQAIGSVALGLIWGVSNYFIKEPIEKMIEQLKKILDERGFPVQGTSEDIRINDTFYPK